MSGFIQQQQHKTDLILGKPANPNTPIVKLMNKFQKSKANGYSKVMDQDSISCNMTIQTENTQQ